MAGISNEVLLRAMIKNPSWCIMFHREQVRLLLPAMAKNHILVTNLEKRLQDELEKLKLEELDG